MIANSTLHYSIIKFVIEKGYAPDVSDLSVLLEEREETVIESLYSLQEEHGVVLHPNEPKIWVIHPFSLAPTHFIVKSKTGSWWSNCAWCSLGVAAIINQDVSIVTTIGAHGDRIEITIRDGKVNPEDLLIHFPVPMQNAWDNVIYTCSTMLVFRTKEEIKEWCQNHKITMGDIQPISKIWMFSKRWYGRHLEKNWHKWTVEEAQKMFKEFDLKGPTWELQASNHRF